MSVDLVSGFTPTSSNTGSLELAWAPFSADELHAWILLRDPRTMSPADLRPEALLRELIRVPIEAQIGRAVIYVPVDRPLGVLLMARDAAGLPTKTPPLSVRAGAPVARIADESPTTRDAEHVPAPSKVAQASDKRAATIPLVFARSRDPLPDLASMARRIAAQVGAVAHEKPPATARRHSFGARQRWTLTRIGFAPSELERVAIVRTTFLDEASLASWETAPPGDALALPAGVDGLVDAVTADEITAFYAVFERGPDGWRSVPLTLLNPPFEASRQPFVVGDAAARLAVLTTRPATSEAQAALVEAALKVLG